MKKKGFTLIEIIVAISLIAVIGTASFFGVRAVNNNLKNKKIEKAYSVFDNALEVYLSEHSEIYDNLAKNTEGAIVTLEVLKNEGLVDDNIKDPVTKEKIDYKNNYYVLSDAVLLSDPVKGEDACKGQVSIEVLNSWKDLTETGIDTSKVLYICPKEETPQESEKISQLEEKVRALQAAMALLDIGEKNYVYFDVNPGNGNELASWPNNENTDKWRIIESKNGELILMYDQPVNTNNYELFYMSKDKDGNIVYDDGMFVDTTGATLKGKSGEFEVFKYARTFREPYYSGDPLIYFNDKIYKGECETEEDDKCIEYRLIESINEGNVYYYMKEDSLYLKNSSLYKNYPVRWYENEWSYMDLIELGSGVPGSKKNILYNSINNKLKNYIIKNKSKYYYITSGGVADSYLLKDETYEDYLGNIDTDMINSKNMNTFIGKEMLLGYYKKETASEDKIGFLSLINGNKSTDGTVSEDVDYMGYDMDDYKSDTLVSMVGCENYYPVIKIKYKDIYFDYDTNIYTNANCNQDNVGTSQCPVIIKLDEGIYSDGVNR